MPNSGHYGTRIPFGLNEGAPLFVETRAEDFSLELRDTNGAPILSLVLDYMSGQWLLAGHRVVLTNPNDIQGVAAMNRERTAQRAAS